MNKYQNYVKLPLPRLVKNSASEKWKYEAPLIQFSNQLSCLFSRWHVCMGGGYRYWWCMRIERFEINKNLGSQYVFVEYHVASLEQLQVKREINKQLFLTQCIYTLLMGQHTDW